MRSIHWGILHFVTVVGFLNVLSIDPALGQTIEGDRQTSTATAAAYSILDLTKFTEEANMQLELMYGAENLEAEGALYFQDGVGALGSPLLSDFATLTWVRKPKIKLELEGLNLGYRLELNGTTRVVQVLFGECKAPLCVDPVPGKKTLGFAFPGIALLTFEEGTLNSSIRALVSKVQAQFPQMKFELFEAISILQVEAPALQMPAILQAFQSEKIFAGFDLNYESYAYPIEFDSAQLIATEATTLDLDSKRTVTKQYRDRGEEFMTSTQVPERLRPSSASSL